MSHNLWLTHYDSKWVYFVDALELGLDEAFDEGLEDAFAAEGGHDEGFGVEGQI